MKIDFNNYEYNEIVYDIINNTAYRNEEKIYEKHFIDRRRRNG